MKNLKTIIRKELFRVFGDKKLVFSLFVVPAILMVVIYSLIGRLASSMNNDIEEHVCSTIIVNAVDEVKTAITAAEYDKRAEITYMTESDFAAKKQELENKVLEGELDLIVYLPENFMKLFNEYKTSTDVLPEITLSYNSAENYSAQAYSLFAGYAMPTLQTILLTERMGSLDVLNVFKQVDKPIIKESKANTQFIAMMLPYMVMILLFAGAMSITVDAFAGEKERGTLASMLVSPVNRTEIAMGKLIALAIVAAISSIVYSVTMVISFGLMGDSMGGIGAEGFGSVKFSAVQIIELLLLLIVLDYLFVALIAFLATISKDTKSASTLVTPVYMVVLVAAMATMFTVGTKHVLTQYFVPLYGTALALQDITTGELSIAGFGAAFASILVLAIALTIGLSKAFSSDKLMFNA